MITVGIMSVCTIYYWIADGTQKAPTIDWPDQLPHLSTVFGNTVFIFIYHHSVPGIIYPVRPQSALPKMFLTANIVGGLLLFLECQLAWYAFSGLPNECEDGTFPCKPDSNGFNQNFNGIPGVGQFVQFYPMLNTAAVPILMISLRNNLMQVLPIKRWLSRYDNSVCNFLAQVSVRKFN